MLISLIVLLQVFRNRFMSMQQAESSWCLLLTVSVLASFCTQNNARAQQIPSTLPNPQEPETPQPIPPLPEFDSPAIQPEPKIIPPEAIPGTIVIKRFEIINNTAIPAEEIERIVKPYTLKQISFIELLEVPQKITQLYIDRGYINTSAVILPQTIQDRVVKISIIPGTIEKITISGLEQLNEGYVRSRLENATVPPLNQQKLLTALQLLQTNILIDSISAELSAGIDPNSSLLEVSITEADTFSMGLNLDNNQVPSIGTFSREIELNENNLSGIGDRLNVAYTNTDGSNALSNLSYEIPLNANNSRLKFTHNRAYNEIIQEPFEPLNIENENQLYDLTYTQPLLRSLEREVNIGFNITRESSQTTYLEDEPFPNVTGATNSDGETIVTTIGFFQDYIKRDEKQVFLLRSHFSLGVDVLDAVVDENKPDSKFVAWRGYTEYLRALSQRNLLSVRSNIQLVNDSLPPVEQYTAGGVFSVRGYPQNILTGDNGVFLSTELRHALLKNNKKQITLEVIPFLDFAKVWNTENELNSSVNTLVGIGAGLKLSVRENLTARLDWGIPLVDIDSSGDSLQENGVYFSLKSRF